MDDVKIILGIIMIISIVIVIFSNAKSCKRKVKEVADLFKMQRTSYEKEAMINEIKQLNHKRDELIQSYIKYKNLIKKEIPIQAKKTILRDKLEESEKHLCEVYRNYINAKMEYENVNRNFKGKIPKQITKEIETSIMPAYILSERKQNNILCLTIISVLNNLLSLLPVISDYSKFFLLLIIFPIFNIILLSSPSDTFQKKQYYAKTIYIVIFLLNILADIYFFIHVYYHWWTDYDAEQILVISLSITIFLLFVLISYVILHLLKKNNKL